MGNHLEHFGASRPAIYLISLPKDVQRRSILNIKPDYTYAVDGSKIINTTKLTSGELGCYLSHVHMLKKALTSPNRYVLVLEDDIGEIPIDSLDSWIQGAPSDFDLLFLSWNYYEHFDAEYESNQLFTWNTGICD